MPAKTLELTLVNGSPENCGIQYGEAFGTNILKFYNQEVQSYENKYKSYTAQCWLYIQDAAPHSADFIVGISRSSKITTDRLVLLLLHEELFQISQQGHYHCTAFAAQSDSGLKNDVLVGQSWDWPKTAYRWPGLLKVNSTAYARTLTYHYPGLWAALGINEYGLALMWTDGFNAPILPKLGLPTYLLIAEILQKKTVAEAIEYLKRIKNAGSFIFLMGDAAGDYCVIEATPDKILTRRSRKPLSRANNFLLHPTNLKFIENSDYKNSLKRQRLMRELLLEQPLTQERCMQVLTQPPIIYGTEPGGMSIDCFLAVCKDRTLLACRGGKTPGPWQKITV